MFLIRREFACPKEICSSFLILFPGKQICTYIVAYWFIRHCSIITVTSDYVLRQRLQIMHEAQHDGVLPSAEKRPQSTSSSATTQPPPSHVDNGVANDATVIGVSNKLAKANVSPSCKSDKSIRNTETKNFPARLPSYHDASGRLTAIVKRVLSVAANGTARSCPTMSVSNETRFTEPYQMTQSFLNRSQNNQPSSTVTPTSAVLRPKTQEISIAYLPENERPCFHNTAQKRVINDSTHDIPIHPNCTQPVISVAPRENNAPCMEQPPNLDATKPFAQGKDRFDVHKRDFIASKISVQPKSKPVHPLTPIVPRMAMTLVPRLTKTQISDQSQAVFMPPKDQPSHVNIDGPARRTEPGQKCDEFPYTGDRSLPKNSKSQNFNGPCFNDSSSKHLPINEAHGIEDQIPLNVQMSYTNQVGEAIVPDEAQLQSSYVKVNAGVAKKAVVTPKTKVTGPKRKKVVRKTVTPLGSTLSEVNRKVTTVDKRGSLNNDTDVGFKGKPFESVTKTKPLGPTKRRAKSTGRDLAKKTKIAKTTDRNRTTALKKTIRNPQVNVTLSEVKISTDNGELNSALHHPPSHPEQPSNFSGPCQQRSQVTEVAGAERSHSSPQKTAEFARSMPTKHRVEEVLEKQIDFLSVDEAVFSGQGQQSLQTSLKNRRGVSDVIASPTLSSVGYAHINGAGPRKGVPDFDFECLKLCQSLRRENEALRMGVVVEALHAVETREPHTDGTVTTTWTSQVGKTIPRLPATLHVLRALEMAARFNMERISKHNICKIALEDLAMKDWGFDSVVQVITLVKRQILVNGPLTAEMSNNFKKVCSEIASHLHAHPMYKLDQMPVPPDLFGKKVGLSSLFQTFLRSDTDILWSNIIFDDILRSALFPLFYSQSLESRATVSKDQHLFPHDVRPQNNYNERVQMMCSTMGEFSPKVPVSRKEEPMQCLTANLLSKQNARKIGRRVALSIGCLETLSEVSFDETSQEKVSEQCPRLSSYNIPLLSNDYLSVRFHGEICFNPPTQHWPKQDDMKQLALNLWVECIDWKCNPATREENSRLCTAKWSDASPSENVRQCQSAARTLKIKERFYKIYVCLTDQFRRFLFCLGFVHGTLPALSPRQLFNSIPYLWKVELESA